MVMANNKLPYELNLIPEDNKSLKFEAETIASSIIFAICIGLGFPPFFLDCHGNLAIAELVCCVFVMTFLI